jgi:hypothetical protein
MMITAIETGTIRIDRRERALLPSSLLLPLEYQSRKVAIEIRTMETKKCAPTIQELRPVRTVTPPRRA